MLETSGQGGRRRPSCGPGLALALAVLLLPLAAVAESLEEAMVQAYRDNPRLQSGRAELRATDEQVAQAVSDWRPTVEASTSTQFRELDTSRGRASLATSSAGIEVTQNLYEGGGTEAAIASAEDLVRRQRALLADLEQTVLLDTISAYTAVYRDQQVLELARSNVERLQRQLQATRDRFEVGEVTRTDVAQAEASVAGAIAERVQAEGDLASSIARYEAVVGRRPGNLEPVTIDEAAPAGPAEASERADKNPQVVAAGYAVDAAEDDVDVSRSDLLPSLDVSGGVNYAEEPSVELQQQSEAFIGATLSVPLYQSGAQYSRVRQNKQVVSQRRQQLDAARRAVAEQVTSAWEQYQAAMARIASLEEQVRANRIALEGVRQEALVGARTVLDVLDAEQELFSSEVDLATARRDRTVAFYTLKSAMGELTARQLELPVDYYNVRNYYEDVRNQWFGTGIQD